MTVIAAQAGATLVSLVATQLVRHPTAVAAFRRVLLGGAAQVIVADGPAGADAHAG